MLLPKRVKYRRVQRGRMTGKATRGNVVCQGQCNSFHDSTSFQIILLSVAASVSANTDHWSA